MEIIISNTEKPGRDPDKYKIPRPAPEPETPALIDIDNLEEFRPVPAFFN